MNRLIIVIVFLLIATCELVGQNLVPNNSFEFYTTCPLNISQFTSDEVSKAFPWKKATYATPDYFNSCSLGANAPNTTFGYQQPRTGNGFVGFYTRCSSNCGVVPNSREYVTAPLLSPLVAGVKYYAAMYINLAQQSWIYPSDKIGICFTIGVPDSNGVGTTLLPYIPQIENATGNIISDTLNWTKICGSFVASGGEDYITIGNFSNDSSTFGTNCYFYLDDVELSTDSNVCFQSVGLYENEINYVYIYPNPIRNSLNLSFKPLIEFPCTIQLYNTYGTQIRSKQMIYETSYTLDCNDLHSGIYFYIVKDKNNLISSGKFIKE